LSWRTAWTGDWNGPYRIAAPAWPGDRVGHRRRRAGNPHPAERHGRLRRRRPPGDGQPRLRPVDLAICWDRLQRKITFAFARRDQRPYDKHGGRRGMRVPLFKAPQIHLPTQGGTTMYSASSKNKLEAAATVAASLLLAAGPPAALAAIQRHEARLARQACQTAAQAERANEDSNPLPI
jgi:hypothetical protein